MQTLGLILLGILGLFMLFAPIGMIAYAVSHEPKRKFPPSRPAE